MGHRICLATISLAMLVSSSCARATESTATASGGRTVPEATAPSTGVSTHATSAPPFRMASAAVAELATAFVTNVAEYDSRRENRTAFLHRFGRIATASEIQRLTRSPRARLPWSSLRRRGEHTRLTVNGVTVTGLGADVRHVIVVATHSTETDFATVSSFWQYKLVMERSVDSWLVFEAKGPGL